MLKFHCDLFISFVSAMRRYKFHLSLENDRVQSYVTEKVHNNFNFETLTMSLLYFIGVLTSHHCTFSNAHFLGKLNRI